MRLICPNCDAQYEIDGALVPPKGRDVECSACGQVWFQAGAATPPPAPLGAAGGGAAPVLSRPLSDSVLSILREEATRELRNREADRAGSAGSALTERHIPAESPPSAPPPAASDKPEAALDLPLVDWPATTVTDLDQAARNGTRQNRIEVPPLTLPDAEKLAATLAPRAAPETPAPPPAEPLAEAAQDPMSLPGDAALDPAEGAELGRPDRVPPAEDTKDDGAQADGDVDGENILPRATALAEEIELSDSLSGDAPDTDAGTPSGDAVQAEAAPVDPAPAETVRTETAPESSTAETLPNEPATPRRDLLPATIVIHQQQAQERAGYRTGFGVAAMVAALVIGGYFLAPRLAGQGEFGAKLMEWRQDADRGRAWLYDQANALFGRE